VLWTAYRVGIYIYVYIYQLCVYVLWAFVCLDPMFEHCRICCFVWGCIHIYIYYMCIYIEIYIHIYTIYHTGNSELCKASEGLGIGKCGTKLF
jgi:hypothetical protein